MCHEKVVVCRGKVSVIKYGGSEFGFDFGDSLESESGVNGELWVFRDAGDEGVFRYGVIHY